MSTKAINEYNAMHEAIQGNIEAIRALIVQADGLTASIAQVENEDLKQRLAEQVASLNSSIDHLISETDKLFKQYIELANSVVIVS